jgi:UbiD family decarboxylase
VDLRSFLQNLPNLKTIHTKVSKDLEVSRHMHEDPAQPMLFENVDGHRVCGNVFPTRDLIARYLGMSKEQVRGALVDAMEHPEDEQETDGPAFMEVTDPKVDLPGLPIPRYYPADGGSYITANVILGSDGKYTNASFHRLMLLGEDTFAVRIVPRHLYAIHQEAKRKGKDLPIAIALGLGPDIMLPAAMSVAYGESELKIASRLSNKAFGHPARFHRLDNGVLAPADAEYVFEARLTQTETKEGPFVDITGTYDEVRQQPVIQVDKVHHRRNPIFQALLSGNLEHYMLMGMPKEPIIERAVRGVVPKVHNVRLTEGGCCWLHGVVSITKQREGDGKNAILAAFAAHPSMKHVIIVDEDVNVENDREVEWAVATRFQGDRDAVMVRGARGSSLDPSLVNGVTAKVGLDCTRRLGEPAWKYERVKLHKAGAAQGAASPPPPRDRSSM